MSDRDNQFLFTGKTWPNNFRWKPWRFVPGFVVGALVAGHVQGQSFQDPSFEMYPVAGGGYLKPATGPWLFANDAGVVAPVSPNSSTGPLHTWSATLAPWEGQRYASTYAALDSIRQSLTFPSSGEYLISVFGAAPAGTVVIPAIGELTLVDGEFTFLLNGSPIGNPHAVPLGSGWTEFSATFTIETPGDYLLGVRSSKAAPYFINYDAFSIEAVPEPSLLHFAGVLGLCALGRRCTNSRRRLGL